MTDPSTQTGTGKLPNTNFPILMMKFSLIQGRKNSNNRDNVLTVAGIFPSV